MVEYIISCDLAYETSRTYSARKECTHTSIRLRCTSGDNVHHHAEQLVAELAANRSVNKATEHPIIFVAHSLGGLVVKRALKSSSEISGTKTEHLRSIFVSTYGILFLATPHKGLNASNWRSRLEAICQVALPKVSLNDKVQLINTLKSNNETLQNIDRQFIQLSHSLHLYFFHEGTPTDLGGGRWEYIIDEESASPTIQDDERAVIQKDHIQMCKFEDSRVPGFDLLTETIRRYTSEAAKIIGPRWDREKVNRLAKRTAEAEELLRTSTFGRAGAHPDSRLSEKPIFTVKFPRDHDFVNWEHIFTEIERQMDIYYCVSIFGWGGVGCVNSLVYKLTLLIFGYKEISDSHRICLQVSAKPPRESCFLGVCSKSYRL